MAKKNEIIVKITCLVAAFALWLYISNTGSPAMEQVIRNVPVTLVNIERLGESNLALLPNQELSVSLTVNGTLTEVYSSNKDKFNIIADINYYALKKGENKIPVIVKDSPNNIKILNKDNLFVTIYLDDVIEKSVPVKVSLLTKTKEGFEDFVPISKPETVIVYGATTFIDRVSYVEAKISIDGFSSNLNKKATLVAKSVSGETLDEDYVTIKPSNVEVSVAINLLKKATVNVKTKGELPPGYKLVSITSNPLEVSYAHNISNDINVTSIDTEAIDLSNIKVNTEIKAKLILRNDMHLVGNDGTVSVSIILDKEVFGKYSIPINVINSDSYIYVIDIKSKEITLKGYQSQISSLKVEDLKITLNLANVTGEGDQILEGEIIGLPSGITISDKNELKIKVNLTKK